MERNYIDLIDRLTTAPGASGFEDAVVEQARQYCAGFADTRENSLRNLYIHRRRNTGERPVVMLDAHSDEVGFMVKAINPNGTLSFITLGGIRAERHEGQRVKVRTAGGSYIPGLISCRPPHFAKDGGQADPLVVDVGATSDQEARERFGVRVGEPIVPDVSFHFDQDKGLIFTKALDCRIGCAALLETLKRLEGESLSVDVTGVISSQEEVGERGVNVAVNQIKPQAAICFEGCPADDTFMEPYEIQTALKKGPMLRFMDCSMIANPRFMRDTIELAERLGLKMQTSVRSGGGNNGAVINLSNQGVPVIVVGIPVRYIHSHYGIASMQDFEAAVELAVAVVREMTPEKIAGF